MGSGDYPPTAAAIKVRDEMVAKIDEQLSKYYEIKDNLVSSLNNLILEKKLSTIIVDKK
jgi:hypothetical protein